MIKTWSGVDSIRADALHRNWDDLVAADEVLGQPVTRMAGHRCLGEESGDLIIDSVLLVFRIHGCFVFTFFGRLLLRLQFCKGREGLGRACSAFVCSPSRTPQDNNSGQHTGGPCGTAWLTVSTPAAVASIDSRRRDRPAGLGPRRDYPVSPISK